MTVFAGVLTIISAVFNTPNPTFVAWSLYDLTSGSPVLVTGPLAMVNVVGNGYSASFAPSTAGKLYVAFMGVYTSSAFTALDPAFAAVQQFIAMSSQNLAPVGGVVGTVVCNNS